MPVSIVMVRIIVVHQILYQDFKLYNQYLKN